MLATRSVTATGVTVPLGGLAGGDYYWSVRVIQVGPNGELIALRSPEAGRRLVRWSPPAQPATPDTPELPPPTDTPVPLPTDTPVPLPTDTPTPPVSRSLVPAADGSDLGAVGSGGGAGLGLFVLVIGLSLWKEWRRDDC